MRSRFLIASLVALTAFSAHAGARPVVLELFTSQGCDSCPPAEAYLTKLAEDQTLLPLTFHVDYWDYIGWKDAFSSKDSTARQYMYAALAGKKSVFTPQVIVDGQQSVIGSRKDEITHAIDAARVSPANIPVTITPGKVGILNVQVDAADKTLKPTPTTLVAVYFTRHATTEVKAGENKGKALTSINNVSKIVPLGTWSQNAQHLEIDRPLAGDTGVAVLLQQTADGRILGAASHIE